MTELSASLTVLMALSVMSAVLTVPSTIFADVTELSASLTVVTALAARSTVATWPSPISVEVMAPSTILAEVTESSARAEVPMAVSWEPSPPKLLAGLLRFSTLE